MERRDVKNASSSDIHNTYMYNIWLFELPEKILTINVMFAGNYHSDDCDKARYIRYMTAEIYINIVILVYSI